MTERNSFKRDTNFNSESDFSRVKFGIDRPILEVELNELQKIQEEKRNSVVRKIVPTGFLETIRRDFDGLSVLFNPVITDRIVDDVGNETVQYVKKMNSIAISPGRLITNGYELELEGTIEIDGIKGYTLIDFGIPPYSTVSSDVDYYDFAFLEIWFEEITSRSIIYKHGFSHGETLNNDIIDDRIGDETSRRVALRHKIRVVKDVDFKKWSNGFGYNETTKEQSRIYAQGPLNNHIADSNYIFMSAANSTFKGTTFYGDHSLYVAGRANYNDETGENKLNKQYGVLEGFIFAVPLFAVKRRNQTSYSLSNPNGAVEYVDKTSVSDRPDGLFNNLIDEKDFMDLRKSISFGHVNTSKMLDSNLKKLMTGELNTNLNDKMTRAQFGLKPINSVSTDYLSNAILHLDFTNQSLLPKLGSNPTTNGGETNYHLSALGYGLSLDGKLVVEYPLTNFNKSQGTIEFLLKPYWDGADENINQTLFTIVNEMNLPIMQLSKEAGKLIFRQKYNGDSASLENETPVDLKTYPLYNNETYHIRLTWLSSNSESKTSVFINGKKVVSSNYVVSALYPRFLKLGAVETVEPYSSDLVGCLVDEFIIYNKILSDTNFAQLSTDITLGDAKIYNSFNGKLTGFQDNEHKQQIISVISTSLNAASFELQSPYGTKMVVDGAVVYNALTGKTYEGVWETINDSTAKFTISLSPTGATLFLGETLWITHTVVVPGGLGIKDVPTKILSAKLNDIDVSFADSITGIRELTLTGESGITNESIDGTISDYIQLDSYKAYDYGSLAKDENRAFARVISCTVKSNGTNLYKIPPKVFGREVLGVKYVDQPLVSCYKDTTGDFNIELVNELEFSAKFNVEIALGGYVFDYETHTKSIVANMTKATTIKVAATGNQKEYVIPASKAINSTSTSVPNGGIIVAFLGLNGKDNSNVNKNFGKSVFVSGPLKNHFAGAIVEGVGTPFIKITFDEIPAVGHFIEIPVLVTYQPNSTDLLSVWYDYSPYQGVLTDSVEKKLTRLTDWRVFATTFGSGKIVTKNIKEKSINNASNRLPGGQSYSYLLDGKDIDFVTEQFTISSKYSANKKLIFRTQFSELIEDDDFDAFSNSLTTEFTVKKKYGKNYQDAFIESSITKIGFVIQDTWEPVSKYLGAACLVVDEEGNVMLFVMGELIKDPAVESIIRPVHGDLFKLEKNPIIIVRDN